MREQNQLVKRPAGLLLFRTDQKQERTWRSDNSYKLLFAIDGAMRYQTKILDISIENEQFLVLNPHMTYKQIGFERKKLLLELSPRLVNDVADSIHQRHTFDIQFAFQIQKHPQLTRWVHFTRDYLQMHDDDINHMEEESIGIFLDHALVQLSLLLLKYGIGSHTNDISTSYIQKASPVLFPVMEAVKESFTEPWKLEEMAAIAGISKYQFAHVFKECIGISPYSWLQLYRLVRSQELLKHSTLSILDISLACGFSSVSVYNQLFKRIYGSSPASFRKRYK